MPRIYTGSGKKEFDLEQYVRSNFHVAHGSGRNELRTNCFYCGDMKYHLYVNLLKRVYNCFRCEESGNEFKFVKDFEQLEDNKDVFATMNKYSSSRQRDKKVEFSSRRKEDLKSLFLLDGFIPLYSNKKGRYFNFVVNWLADRGVSLDDAKYFGMGYCIGGDYDSRIIVPIFYKGKLVSFIARTWLEDWDPKVKNPPVELCDPPSKYLFGYDDVIGRKELYIVEGVWDAISLKPNAVALNGKVLSVNQLALLHDLDPNVIYVTLDPDADQSAAKVYNTIEGLFDRVRYVSLPRDPDECTREEIISATVLHETDRLFEKEIIAMLSKKPKKKFLYS